MNLVLIGFQGSGKSSLGALVSDATGYRFLDTDKVVEDIYQRRTGLRQSCREIFRKEGESFFRLLENEAVTIVAEEDNAIIATGGGTVVDPENAQKLKSRGVFCFLEIDRKLIKQRVLTQETPAYLADIGSHWSFEKIYCQRREIYRQLADYTLECGELCLEILLEKILSSPLGESLMVKPSE
ncbi:MAG: shikimate kinase [Chlamydiota bacterium]